MPNDFAISRARETVARAQEDADAGRDPYDFEYGHAFQSTTQGIHGSHRAMTTPPVVAARTEVEERTGIDSLEWLLDQRRSLVAEVAPLRAKYGPGGSWDARRKAHRSAIANQIATQHEKISEAALERLAAAHEDVTTLLDMAEQEMARLAILENAIAEVTERIKNRNAELYFLGAEARLGG